MPTKPTKPKYAIPAQAVRRLSHVQKQILDEPRRLNMDEWIATDPYRIQCLLREVVPSHLTDKETEKRIQAMTPPCGTVGCIAGWVCANARKKSRLGPGYQSYGQIANRLLGFDNDTSKTGSLFYVGSWPRQFEMRLQLARPGTRKYALVVNSRIEHFKRTGE